MSSIAAAAFRGNTLYVLYSTSVNNLGTLYAITPPTASRNVTNAGPNTMLIQSQNLPVGPTNRAPNSITMVPILVKDPRAQPYRNDLLIALNMPQASPLLLRLQPVAPNLGDGKVMEPGYANWTVAEDSLDVGMVPQDATQVSLATGTAGGPEGTAVYEVFVSKSAGNLVQKMDVTNLGSGVKSSPAWALPIDQFLDNTSNPKMKELYKKYLYIVKQIINDDIWMLDFADNGNLVMATTSRIMTYSYSTADFKWSPHAGKAILPSGILACTTAGSKLYAITQGNTTVPTVHVLDMGKPSWDWQAADLVSVRTDIEVIIPTPSPTPKPGTNPGQRPDNDNGGGDSNTGTNPDTVSSSQGSGLSTPVIVAIAIGVLLILLLIAFIIFWRRRKNKKKSTSPYHVDQKEVVSTTAPAYSPSLKKHSGKFAHEYDGGSPRSNYSRDYRDYDRDGRDDYDSYPRHGGDSPSTRYAYSPQSSYSPFPSSRPTEQVNMLTMPVATPPETPLQNHRRTESNDKEEFARENGSQYTASTSSVANPQTNLGGFLHPGGSPKTAPRSKKRLQETLSPGLANAQLILQQNQAARNAAARNNANKF
ncbi:hypothetical protein BGZ51_001090 [Haplosporangium sp. Z 767]|nr:hypothetical protein BGZ51_001090 [Haplosporangium sp. Z 767]